MRLFTQQVLLRQVFNQDTVYTDPQHNALLGSAERLAVQVNGENVSNSPTVTVKLEHSNDGQNFVEKSTLINAQAICASPIVPILGYETGTTATCSYARLKISMAGTGNALLTVIVCGRGEQACGS